MSMLKARTCPECGAELPPDAPRGLCPRCLLKAGLVKSRREGAGSSEPTAYVSPGAPAEPPAAGGRPEVPRARFAPPDPRVLAQSFPQLEILELLGQGGMGVVYKARQRGLDRLVALKLLPPEVGSDPAFSERFSREAKALAKLSHSHIVTVHDFGNAGGLYYLLMEYVDGPNLREVLRARRLSPREALGIVPQVCDALQYAHDEGVVHRDIKPENVLLDGKGRVKIADFGLAKLVARTKADLKLTGPRQVMGTPNYMAPEQWERPQEVDHRADIYSLGVLLYEMLTGELPLGRFAPPSEKVEVDVRLDEVVLRTLEKDPARRYQRASEVKTDLETAAGGTAGAAPGRSRRRRAVLLAGAAAVLILGLSGVAVVRWGRSGLDRDLEARLARIIDPGCSFDDRDKLWEGIRAAGLVDPALQAAERKALLEPRNADLQVCLGRACILKLTTLSSDEDRGRLAIKADLAYDAALALDPKHWEARFQKAMALAFWPPIFGKQAESIRQFEILIRDQEALAPEPKFAHPYLFLGNLYRQSGKADAANETWKRGLSRFPGNKDLWQRVSEAEAQ